MPPLAAARQLLTTLKEGESAILFLIWKRFSQAYRLRDKKPRAAAGLIYLNPENI